MLGLRMHVLFRRHIRKIWQILLVTRFRGCLGVFIEVVLSNLFLQAFALQ